MDIRRFIDRLRQAPEGRRQQVAFMAALVVTILIFAGWVLLFRLQYRAEEERAAGVNGPFDALKQNIAESFAAFQSKWKSFDIKNIIESEFIRQASSSSGILNLNSETGR